MAPAGAEKQQTEQVCCAPWDTWEKHGLFANAGGMNAQTEKNEKLQFGDNRYSSVQEK